MLFCIKIYLYQIYLQFFFQYLQMLLKNSSNIETVSDAFSTCELRLTLVRSHALSITNSLGDLNILDSTVDYISNTGNLTDIFVMNSKIGIIHSISWYKHDGTFESSHFDTISNMRVLSNLNVDNSTINIITSNGVEISSHVYMTNTTIRHVEREAFIIKSGILVLQNVTIDSVVSHSFDIEPEGTLELINVSISKGSLRFIKGSGTIKLQNVTLEGYTLEWNYLRHKKSESKILCPTNAGIDPNSEEHSSTQENIRSYQIDESFRRRIVIHGIFIALTICTIIIGVAILIRYVLIFFYLELEKSFSFSSLLN